MQPQTKKSVYAEEGVAPLLQCATPGRTPLHIHVLNPICTPYPEHPDPHTTSDESSHPIKTSLNLILHRICSRTIITPHALQLIVNKTRDPTINLCLLPQVLLTQPANGASSPKIKIGEGLIVVAIRVIAITADARKSEIAVRGGAAQGTWAAFLGLGPYVVEVVGGRGGWGAWGLGEAAVDARVVC